MVNAAACKKHQQIVNRIIFIALIVCYAGTAFSQTSEQKNPVKKNYVYKKSKNYKGPQDWYGSSPASMNNEDNIFDGVVQGESQSNSGLSIDKIDQSRNSRGSGGNLPTDPATQKAEPIQLPEFDPPDLPDVDAPDLPDIDPPRFSPEFWKTILIIILAAIFIFIVYWYIRNKKPSDKAVTLKVVDLEWNPEVITKTELELRLEEALLNQNYREGVRIYFTFILKELIRNNWIHWKKEKTNHDYLLETLGKPNAHLFAECVRIYDLVWYGEYEIDEAVFEQIKPTLHNYYQLLEKIK